MSDNEKKIRIIVNKHNKAALTCHKCGTSRAIDASNIGFRSDGDFLDLNFMLDDPRKTSLKIGVIVRHIRKYFFSSEINDFHGHKADIGFYVLTARAD